MKYISNCKQDTVQLGKKLAQSIKSPLLVAFFGDLGAGKTAFVSGMAEGLGYTGQTYSPTFAIVNCYEGGRVPLYHFDMYRIAGWEDLYSTGYFDYLEQNCVMAVEWSENITSALPDDRIEVIIKRGAEENERSIEINCVGGIELEGFGC